MSRRQALLEKFRAGTQERIRRMDQLLGEIEHGGASTEKVRQIGRDLHTFKGESRMLGLLPMGDIVHELEELIGGKNATGIAPELCRQLSAVLNTLSEALEADLSSPESMDGAVEKARGLLGDIPAAEEAPTETPEAPPNGKGEEPAPRARSGPPAVPGQSQKWMRVNTERIDDLCERVSVLSADLRRLQHNLKALTRDDRALEALTRSSFEEMERVGVELEELTSAAWSLRLVPVEPMLVDVSRHARSLATAQGKSLRVSVDCAGVEVERTILDELWEPLIHLVRNAVDHGLEDQAARKGKSASGKLGLVAESFGPHVVLTVEDDGRGVDFEGIRQRVVARDLVSAESAASLSREELADFLFVHGFSTRDEISDLSGRGVGLDVVRDAVESLGGSVRLESEPGAWTRFVIRVPSTISKERVLVVRAGGIHFGVSARQIREVIRLRAGAIKKVARGRVVQTDTDRVTLRSLSEIVLGHPDIEEPWGLLVESGGRSWVVSVPEILGEFELMRRPLDELLNNLGYIAASSSLDDGSLVLFLIVSEVVRAGRAVRPSAAMRVAPVESKRTVLVVDDSPVVVELLTEILTGAGFAVTTALNGKLAIDAMRRSRPNLVLADVDMPVMDGFELLRAIREETQELPVVMLTTRASVDDRRRAAALGADAYLVKSDFQETTLVETVQRFVRGGP